jgi:diaminohydroxyphosphoribosylaminopyrimidine deaminase/5-amino-6-(5-phosphoribosylamino)uracil reductase
LSKDDDAAFMRRALALARRGQGETNPNPLVGCVVVKDGRIVGEGFHARAGRAHAEAAALVRAGTAARGATLYVNLEPCAHHGRTPPCAPAVAAAGVVRVVAAVRDANPAVAGKGLAQLRKAGVAVTLGVLARDARHLNHRFLHGIAGKRPYVTLKAAMTLDGRIATASGESKWLTSEAQRRSARALRRLHDGVLVGIGTVLADDPLLLPAPPVRRPFARVVVDSNLRIPLESQLVQTAAEQPLVVLCSRDADPDRRHLLERRAVQVWPIPAKDGRLDLAAGLRRLRSAGLVVLMVEGGSEILGAFLAARLFDEAVFYRAALLLGGRNSRPAFGGPEPRSLKSALAMRRARPPHDDEPPLAERWFIA